MKIAHIGLASFYTDGMTYQDNQLAQQNVRDGHEVLYVSNAAKYVNGKIVETGYEDTVLPCGVRLVRLPYRKILTASLSEKIRKVDGLYELLCRFRPDVILCHGLCFQSCMDAVRYKNEHPEIKLFADNHADYGNSGKSWVSRRILHGIYYRHLVRKALPCLEKFFYITWTGRRFVMENYGVPEDMLEFFPLGGDLIDEVDYVSYRQSVRDELNISSGEYLFIHTGKLDALKKTEQLLKAFSSVPELRAKLAIIGSVPDEMKDKLMPLIESDSRIIFLGWKNSAELTRYLCGCDLYLQPGSGSATLQNAVCMKCPVLSYPHEYYIHGYDRGNFLWVRSEDDIKNCFEKIVGREIDLASLSEKSELCANELLDYRIISARLYR